MKLASYSLRTSFAMARSRSEANTRFFCRMGGKEGDTFSLCTMTEGSILGMSSWLQVKTSRLFLRKVMSTWWTAGSARVPILVIRSSLESSRSTSTSSLRAPSLSGVLLWSWLGGGHPFPSWLRSIYVRPLDSRVALPPYNR